MNPAGKTLDQVFASLPPRFELQTILASLGDPALAGRFRDRIEAGGAYFDDGAGHYRAISDFLNGAEFLITPDANEIESGILVPGHRFAPFVSEEIFPSEVKLLDASGAAFSTRPFTGKLVELFPYCLLLGSEQIFDYLIADHPDNARLRKSARGDEPVTLQVFDLDRFFIDSDFSEGDALLCTVESWTDGIVRVRHLPEAARTPEASADRCARLADALDRVIERFENYLEIPAQLSWACYFSDGALTASPGASTDEFIRTTDRIEIGFDGGHSSLIRRIPESDAELEDGDSAPDTPDGFGISGGETGSVEGILCELGLSLTPAELEGLMLDSLNRRQNFDDFFARVFGDEPLPFTDAGQEAVFMNQIEDRYEVLASTYDRVADEPKAGLRAAIVELIERKNAYLRSAAEPLAADEMRKLAAISLGLNELLRTLNDPREDPDAPTLERASARVADAADRMAELLGDEI